MQGFIPVQVGEGRDMMKGRAEERAEDTGARQETARRGDCPERRLAGGIGKED